jgi:hypothetical protein
MGFSGLAYIGHVEIVKTEYGVTNENVDYTSYNLSHVVKSREVQPVVGELTIYDNGTAVYKPRAIGLATKTDINVVANFVLMVVKSDNLSLKVW